jgi:hypothetical protein
MFTDLPASGPVVKMPSGDVEDRGRDELADVACESGPSDEPRDSSVNALALAQKLREFLDPVMPLHVGQG